MSQLTAELATEITTAWIKANATLIATGNGDKNNITKIEQNVGAAIQDEPFQPNAH